MSEIQPGDGPPDFRLRRLPGLSDYLSTLEAMRDLTARRDAATPDELWLLQHPPVFTLGQAGRREHLLAPGDIPVVQSDRGGQVTYHGPGQVILYLLFDLRRAGFGVKRLVNRLEQSVIDLLQGYDIEGIRRSDAPGVYVDDAKIASLGLRIRQGCSYHGIALNVAMDLEPFRRINPCGYAGLAVTQLMELVPGVSVTEVGNELAKGLEFLIQSKPRPE